MPSKRKPQPQRKSQALSTAEVVRNKKKTTQMPSRRSAPQSSKVPTRRAPTRGKKIVEVESELSDLTSSDTEEIEEVEDDDVEVVPNKRGRGSTSKKPPTKPTAKKTSAATTPRKNSRAAAKSKITTKIQDTSTTTDDETSQKSTAEEDGNTKPLFKRGKATATVARRVPPSKRLTKKEREAQAQAEREIAETQYTPMDVDESTEEEEDEGDEEEEYGGKDQDGKSDEEDKDEVEEVGEEDEEDDVTSAQPPPIAASRKRSAPAAAQRQQPATKKMILSKSENTAVEDALRSQLEEMTRRYEEADRRLKALTKLKYTDAEIALREYKETMQARIDASEKLNAALQEDLKAYQTLGAENKKFKRDLKDKDTEINKLAIKITTLEQALFESDTEIKSLNAKLTVARQATSAPPPPPSASSQPIIPGSAVKPKPQPHTNGHHHHYHHHHSHASTPSTNAIPWEILAKEELYGDLTALTILGVKVFPEQPDLRVYDCIQTGKNGTLHFKLTTPINGTNEEDEFTFTPHLDPQRDSKILSLLPEYLTEEITFGRGNATRFYLKLLGVVLRNENHGTRQESGSVGPAGGGEEE